ncbi:MAG: DUF4097 domain-containing protein [Oscillospiraceae bacterium]|jgi:hypothetical protein|nr:DUF4097 domain-containing protein [Oscillospiraceae bacterium]
MRIKGLSKGSPAVKLFWFFASLALLSGGAALLAQIYAHELFGWTSTVHRERREVTPAERVNISSADIPLEVFTYDGEKIIVEYIGESALVIAEDESGLRIFREEDFTLSLFSTDILNYAMTVWLPKQTYKEVRLTTASGDINAENISAEFISVTSRTGNIDLYDIEGLASISTRYGDVKVEFVNFTDICVIDTETGKTEVIMPTRFPVRLDFLTDTGSFTSDFFRREYDGHQGDLYLVTGVNPVRITVRTGSGSLYFCTRDESVG